MRQRRLLKLNHRLDQRGDTIVEVLLAIAIVSSVLGGAFVSANHSMRGARMSQERGEALKLVEGQLERLKAATAPDSSTADDVFGATSFCMRDDLQVETILSSSTCNQGPDGRYHLSIRHSGDVFTASAEWTRIGGNNPQPEQVNIVYKVHQP